MERYFVKYCLERTKKIPAISGYFSDNASHINGFVNYQFFVTFFFPLPGVDFSSVISGSIP